MTRSVVFGLGSNVGSRVAFLRAAAQLFSEAFHGDVRVAQVRLTEPVGPAQPDFANTALLVRTEARPEDLLALALRIEEKLGRVRTQRWGPRTIDVDVLWVEGEVHQSETLSIPHARLHERAFALAPLLELCPDAVDPRTGGALAAFLRGCVDVQRGSPQAWEAQFATREITDHTADQGFEVTALDRADLLAGCAEALAHTMVRPVGVRMPRMLAIEAASPSGQDFADDDERMVTWLSEVLFRLDSDRFAARRVCVVQDGPRVIKGFALGEPLDVLRHECATHVKAVTWHDLHVGPSANGESWLGRVIVDV
ncbi:MAG: 2-amino-4-hydroxy-6-hydroxymethyldihydropteridine diphosphokinase [Deltaproteobacteria bacterium]|nr:2-amino-4-hydroxy-6-hydroxymethyldihydropteridine diphosphokinase [Deltaproteobacteria bacterium]